MRKKLAILLSVLLCASALGAAEDNGSYVRYSGTGTNDNDVLFTTGDGQSNVARFSRCIIMSTTGAVDVFVSLDGTNYSTAALSLQDMGATDNNPVLATVALRVYGFVVKARKIKVLQNGATGAAASMNCW